MKKELIQFYKKRKDRLSGFEHVDYTDVFDSGIEKKRESPIMIIGEAPGFNEVESQTPFVGPAGKNLDYLIGLSGLNRKQDFLITNAFPFRTFEQNKNRTPKASELKAGSTLLLQEIEIVKPRLILLLGNSAIHAFSYLPNAKEVKTFDRNSFNPFNFRLFSTVIGVSFHPSPISFNRKEIRCDLENFFLNLKYIAKI